jgi:hypothetical protein
MLLSYEVAVTKSSCIHYGIALPGMLPFCSQKVLSGPPSYKGHHNVQWQLKQASVENFEVCVWMFKTTIVQLFQSRPSNSHVSWLCLAQSPSGQDLQLSVGQILHTELSMFVPLYVSPL